MATNIDPAIVEALEQQLWDHRVHIVTAYDARRSGHLLGASLAPLIAAAVDAARAEGDKQGAARVREAVEAVLGFGTSWIPVDATSDERALACDLIHDIRAAVTEAAPHD